MSNARHTALFLAVLPIYSQNLQLFGLRIAFLNANVYDYQLYLRKGADKVPQTQPSHSPQ